MVDFDLELGKLLLPKFPLPEGFTEPDDYLAHLAREGLHRRYDTITPELEERLEYELGVIRQTGYAGYFLIVWDFIDAARRMDIPVGPGRGSAAGSLVCYAIAITDIDPIRHKLLFERFLNPERISMPDIDVDFCFEKRGQVIEYVAKQVRPGERLADHHLRHHGGQGGAQGRGAGAGVPLRRQQPHQRAGARGARASPCRRPSTRRRA